MSISMLAAASAGAAPIWTFVMLSQGIMNVMNQRNLAEKNRELQEKMEEDRIHFQIESFQKTADLQKEITMLNHNLRLTEQKQAFENAMQAAEFSCFMQNWPLITPPFVMRDETMLRNMSADETRVGLRIILTKGSNSLFNRYVHESIEHGLFKFINKYYSKSQNCPVFFYSGGWKNASGGGGAVNSMLHYALKNLPTLIIDPKIVNGMLNLDVAVWGLGVGTFLQDTILEIPFEQRVEKNVVDEKYYMDYAKELGTFLNYTVGWIADTYNLLEYNQFPIGPEIILKELNSDKLSCFMREHFAQKYKSVYDYILGAKSIVIEGREVNLSEFKKCTQPDLCLGFLESTYKLMEGDPTFCYECIRDSMSKWLELRGIITENQNATYMLGEICKASESMDIQYLNSLKESYTILRKNGDPRAANAVSVLNRRIVWLK